MIKRKRKELLANGDEDDTEDAAVLALRWSDSIDPGSPKPVGGTSAAVWLPRHRLAVVTSLKGKMISTLGETALGGKLCLLPEDALFLTERGYLDLYLGDDELLLKFDDVKDPEKSVLLPNSDNGPEKTRRLTTAAQWYSYLTEAAGVPLACYLVYRGLRDRQFVVRRPPALLGMQGLAAKGDEVWRRVSPKEPPLDLPVYLPSAKKLDFSMLAFEAFPWTTNFSKARCGSPEFRVLVVRTGDRTPSVLDLHQLTSEVQAPIQNSKEINFEASCTSYSSTSAEKYQLKVASVDDEGTVQILHIKLEMDSRPVRKHRRWLRG